MSYTTLPDLHDAIATWFEQNIVASRTSGDTTRQWSTAALKYTDAMTQAAMRAFIDRTQLNEAFVTQYTSQDINDKKDLVMIKIEIHTLYSFLKCFVERHKTRLIYYKDDLSQKGSRNMYNVKLRQDPFVQMKQELGS